MAYRVFMASITGAEYERQKYGPVPRGILVVRAQLRNERKTVERRADIAGLPGDHIIAIEPPDVSDFLPREIQLVDAVMNEICDNHTATSISALSHDLVWHAAQMGEIIPYYAWLAATPVELTDEDFSWANDTITNINVGSANA